MLSVLILLAGIVICTGVLATVLIVTVISTFLDEYY